ncbi:arf-GAP with Rho-GAP domain, ANK repeat and PH domain-containing protein 1 isoform X1 [Tachysurus fulvidraco]|uniref:arf-GAP with Rho-GAP domain, ANK repeat and PH domain-containing protein 1 isoform X1 n=1 Tax=Tachysurus fulvidraco TaxID=1234273 RepID=UPI001FED5223|nr:arf-GAP with Rho-GAP domain, ANK repeat and PH domain-containing protein 1 isoform X1 [Tachysurus fulvidraco]XP_027024653.2 arf-GAP with Rho-GAP domain, ANK repeat and PH domain-containing protein 1 isoform X1 [Tachysurus fulvidraco]
MTAPVPKPRTRYMFSKNLQNGSTESSNVIKDETQTDNKVNGTNVNADSCVSPAGLPRLRETHDSSGADIVERFLWPSSPPQSPLASDDEDFEISECVKENVTSDSSTDEGLVTPFSPQTDTANDLHPPEECHNSTESAPEETNSQPNNAALYKTSVLKKPKQTPTPKKPRAATIRVSRRKSSGATKNVTQAAESFYRESAVSRSSWLDVWKGRKHNVLWTTFDGQVMALWKKRTDKFSEYVFHVSSITNLRQQDRGHFLIYFRKKHFEFMAPSEDVRMGWITSLLASRGREAPAPPLHHGSLTMKEPRSKVYCSISGHNLWIYNSKEDFNLGLGMTFVYMNVASVKQTGRHSFSLVTPYKTFNFSADSSRDLATWLDLLNAVIRSALSCSEVALRLWSSPWNKVCADCGSPNPEWASINLLMVICEACAGVHRMMGANRSKVRSLKLDVKVWTEPLIQLFVLYGNKASNNVWGHNVPAVDQISPTAETQQRTVFINTKYCSGLYRKAHPLSCSQKLLNQRLREVVCGADVEETLSLLCSGAKVLGGGGPSAITVAENAGQALQTELLRHNEFVETPDFEQQTRQNEQTRLEELHGRLDDERFLFSQETQSAACDVLDLREVISVFNQSTGQTHEFEILTLTDSLTCTADTREMLLNHMLHIIKVVMPNPLLEEELDGVMGVSQLSLREGSGLKHAEVWVMIRAGEIIIYPLHTHTPRTPITLNQHTRCNLCLLENTVEVITAEKTVYLQFEREESCSKFYTLLSSAASCDRKSYRRSLYTLPAGVTGRVPAEVQRCISHITLYGLKVEGLYRCCGSVTKISELVEKLHKDPEVVLETNEIFVQEVAGALKHFLRNSTQLIPSSERESWVSAAALTEVTSRLREYRRLVKLLPPDNRALLSALFSHLNNVQLYSQVNKMTASNLAVVFVPTLFEDLAMNQSIVHLMRELIIHHTLIFLGKDEAPVEEEMITAL